MPEELANAIALLKTGLAGSVTDEPTRAELEYAIDQIVEVARRSHPWERLAAHVRKCREANPGRDFHCSMTLFPDDSGRHNVLLVEHMEVDPGDRVASQYDTDLSAAVDRCIAEFPVKP